eukprot:Amastigsp_a2752_11.p5 type:complete len:119 gc:universal Amastigsp_a2752_11:462-818(+)
MASHSRPHHCAAFLAEPFCQLDACQAFVRRPRVLDHQRCLGAAAHDHRAAGPRGRLGVRHERPLQTLRLHCRDLRAQRHQVRPRPPLACSFPHPSLRHTDHKARRRRALGACAPPHPP